MLAAVNLQPSDMALLNGAQFTEIATTAGVSLAAPIAFGDSYKGAPVVGTTVDFFAHLAGDLTQGRVFAVEDEAVVGAHAPLSIGDIFSPAHGHGPAAEHDTHAGQGFHIVGRMSATVSPWDSAILVPVEAVWEIHGLANGHAPDAEGTIDPPFDPTYPPERPQL
jgi:putative ABC transport system permease protein